MVTSTMHSSIRGMATFNLTHQLQCTKMGDQVAAAVVHGSVTKTTKLPDKSSIFRALAAIRRSKEKNFFIFSDSMSSLEAISAFKLKIDIVQKF